MSLVSSLYNSKIWGDHSRSYGDSALVASSPQHKAMMKCSFHSKENILIYACIELIYLSQELNNVLVRVNVGNVFIGRQKNWPLLLQARDRSLESSSCRILFAVRGQIVYYAVVDPQCWMIWGIFSAALVELQVAADPGQICTRTGVDWWITDEAVT